MPPNNGECPKNGVRSNNKKVFLILNTFKTVTIVGCKKVILRDSSYSLFY